MRHDWNKKHHERTKTLSEHRNELGEFIGTGQYGVVASAIDLKKNDKIAVKHIIRVMESYPMATRIIRAHKFLSLLRDHENVLKIKFILVYRDCERIIDTFVI